MSEILYNGGLVLEGGGMRGLYTAGVLDFFIDKGIYFKNCYGVSAGASQCCSYLSKQKGRALEVNTEYMKDKRYASVSNLVRGGNYFDKEFSLKTIPDELVLFDYETFSKKQSDFYVVATNCKTGKPEYLKVEDMSRDIDKVWASCSLPLLSKMVEIDGEEYLDGGASDAIPFMHAIKSGNEKVVVILTRDAEYRKSPEKMMPLIKMVYHDYPRFVRGMKRRHARYNKTLMKITKFEKAGKIFVIRPKETVEVGRLEKNPEKMKNLYDSGYNDAMECFDALCEYMNR